MHYWKHYNVTKFLWFHSFNNIVDFKKSMWQISTFECSVPLPWQDYRIMSFQEKNCFQPWFMQKSAQVGLNNLCTIYVQRNSEYTGHTYYLFCIERASQSLGPLRYALNSPVKSPASKRSLYQGDTYSSAGTCAYKIYKEIHFF